jgi:hypothetical protein
MLKAAFLGCALILHALFAPAIAWQPDFGPMNIIIDNTQIPLGQHDYQLVCHGLSRSISPSSEVFFPGALVSFSNIVPLLTVCLHRHSSIRRRHHTLDQLDFGDIHVLRATWDSRGPQFDRSWTFTHLDVVADPGGYCSFGSLASHALRSGLSVLGTALTVVFPQRMVSKSLWLVLKTSS